MADLAVADRVRADPVEARRAMDRLVQARLERQAGRPAALCANRSVRLPWGPYRLTPRRLGRGPALGAASRLVHQAARGVKLLLAGREHKFLATIAAGQGLVHVGHLRLLSFPEYAVGAWSQKAACFRRRAAPRDTVSTTAR